MLVLRSAQVRHCSFVHIIWVLFGPPLSVLGVIIRFIAPAFREICIDQYDLKNRYIDCFDDELYRLFVDTYNNSLNGDRRELCWALKDVDFNNGRYSTEEDRAVTIKNFRLLLQELDGQIKTNTDQMMTAIAKSFRELLEEKISSYRDPE